MTHLSSFPQPRNLSLGATVFDYRIVDTPIVLRICFKPEITIEPADLSRTLLQTQIRLRRYIATHYHADEDVLFHFDDPYLSSKQYTGCFFAITHWPLDQPKRLTYGMVNTVLTGIFEVMYRQEHYIGALALVTHDLLGLVGFAEVLKDRHRRPSYAISNT